MNLLFNIIEDGIPEIRQPWKGFVIEAYHGNLLVGYLKITYIPSEKLKQHFPTILHYAQRQGGWCIPDLPDDLSKLSGMEKSQIVKSCNGYLNFIYSKVTPENVGHIWKEFIKKINWRFSRQYKDFVDFHSDKPLVDFIRVDDEWRRRGIALQLYQYGAEFVTKKLGLQLHASGIQQLEAKRAWDKMTKLGWTKNINGRLVLDGKNPEFSGAIR